jgi:hypothetical protein
VGKSLKRLQKKIKKLSPVVLRTVKGAKKGIYTTVKLCKKTAKTTDIEESFFMVLFFMLKLVASVSLKAAKNMVSKGRLPKYNFIKKHTMRAAGYFTVLPVVLISLIQLIQMFEPSYLNYIKYILILYWLLSTAYQEIVVGKKKKVKTDKTDKPLKRKTSLKASQQKEVSWVKRVTPTAMGILVFAERVSELVHITDFLVLLVGMSVYEALCAADVS